MKSSSLSPSDATWDAKEFRDRKGHDCQYKTYSTAPQIIPLCTISFASPSPAQTCEKKTNVGINSTQASQQECTNSTQITQLQGWTLQQVRNMHAGRRQPAPTRARAKKRNKTRKSRKVRLAVQFYQYIANWLRNVIKTLSATDL